jgi:adenylate kinase
MGAFSEISNNPLDPKSNYSDKEYSYRRALPSYEYLRSLENKVMLVGKEKPELKTFVLCSGLVYGHGEDSLFEIFETAFDGKEPL